MHDPMTVAFEIRYPWRASPPSKHFPNGYRNPFITIWHVDPEKGGSDNSCDWFGHRRKLNLRERALTEAIDNLLHRLGNEPFYPDGPGLYGKDHHRIPLRDEDTTHWDRGLVGELQQAWYGWRVKTGFRWHPRWHFWHWRLQVHPLMALKRWAFTRCAVCGGRFKWNESGLGTWSGDGPRWFRSEHLTHMNGLCDALRVPGVLEPQDLPGARS